MTDDHLPECLMWDVKVCMCICLELRACEQRMLDDDVFSAAYHGQKGYDIGYAAALDRAVQRVEERVWYTPEVSTIHAKSYDYGFSDCKERILTALRDLQEKP